MNDPDIESKHRLEKKALQAEIQRLKKSVTKGDKNKLNEVHRIIKEMEIDLENKQQNELESFTDQLSEILTTQCDLNEIAQCPVKISRAAKRREKKATVQENQNKAIVNMLSMDSDTLRSKELEKINELLSKNSLVIHEVPSDGNCLFSSISHQLELLKFSKDHLTNNNTKSLTSNTAYTVKELRSIAAEYIRSHANTFLPFLFNHDTGKPLQLDELDTYCNNLRDTTFWGGHSEILALSSELKRPIEVIQANSPKITVGENFTTQPLVITYHRHAFSLGEHYNSCRPLLCEP